MNDHTYTEEDFKNARFAEHPDGTYGARTHPHMSMWSIYDKKRQMVNSYTDEDMARFSFRPVHETAPLSLDTLREAWENAEVLTGSNPVREGDELIYHRQIGGFGFRAAECADDGASAWRSNVRVHRRAPQPEPWQALADEMEELYDGYSVRAAEAAQFLHERGVRVTGGDEA